MDGAPTYPPRLMRYLLRRNQARANKAIRPSTPPTTLPAIAPALLLLVCLTGDGVGEDVEDGVVVGVPDLDG